MATITGRHHLTQCYFYLHENLVKKTYPELRWKVLKAIQLTSPHQPMYLFVISRAFDLGFHHYIFIFS
ncbi:rCG61004, partial [Rattus norvegicus]